MYKLKTKPLSRYPFSAKKTIVCALVFSSITFGNFSFAQTDTPPSDNFDLSNWKLTLPVSEESYLGDGDEEAAEILPRENCTAYGSSYQLDDGYIDNDYFFTNSDGNMIFATPLNDGATTVTSSYVRTELRELFGWTPCDGDGEANWLPSGSHTLSGTVKVNEYFDGDSQTIVGQIHAGESSYALVKLQWDGPNSEVRAIINADPTESSNFDISFGLIPGTNEWSYVIEMVDDTVTISVTYDGSTVSESVTFGEGEMSSEWNNYDYYFKAGSYPQAEVGSDGAFEVEFSSLQVNHSG